MLSRRSRPEEFEDPQLYDDFKFDEDEFSAPDPDTSELAEPDNFVANSSYGELRWTTPESEDEYSSDGEDRDGDMSVGNANVQNQPELSSHRSTSSITSSSRSIIQASQINWTWTRSSVPLVIDQFDDSRAGLNINMQSLQSELDCFKSVLGKSVVELTVLETNKFARQVMQATENPTKRQRKWKEVTTEDFMNFLTVRILMGINQKPEQKNYWSRDPLLGMPVFSRVMSSDRYFEILKHLHFCNNEQQEPGDRIHKIRKVWEYGMNNFRALVSPGKDLSIDESLILFKGRLAFKQYIPSKRSRFGIKTFSIVDYTTGFILFFIIYSGKGHEFRYSVKDFGYGGAIVFELLEPFLKKGHYTFMDNFFTSPNLATKLLEANTYICGTVRQNRKHVPTPKKKMKQGDIDVFYANGVIVQHWKDKKIVSMICTNQDHSMDDVTKKSTGKTMLKPSTVLEYNKKARGIDLGDMQMQSYSVLRKTCKWYKKYFSGKWKWHCITRLGSG